VRPLIDVWKVGVLDLNATDNPLTLHNPNNPGDTNNSWKAYGVESTAWKILSMFLQGGIPGRIAQIIWDDMDGDTIN
jgi:hypothetical protein